MKSRLFVLVAAFAMAKVLIHVLLDGAGGYGYFRDELYYLDCADHLQWGYVDHPPLSVAVLWATRALLGDSTLAIRLPAALAGAATVALTGVLAATLGGGLLAVAVACLAVLAAPVHLAFGSFFSMNPLDAAACTAVAVLVARALEAGRWDGWPALGVVLGLGLLDKYDIGFFAAALAAGILATPQRRMLADRRPWAAAGIAALLFAPHLAWQAANGWPTLDFLRETSQYKNLPMSLPAFLGAQVLFQGPLAAPLWVAGLGLSLAGRSAPRWRAFGVAWLLLLAFFVASHGKPYYLAPAALPLLAIGAVGLERGLARLRPVPRRALGATALALLAAGGVILAPEAMPVLAPADYLAYAERLGIRPPQQERGHEGRLPQHLGDRLGWEELVATIGDAWARLDPAERARASVFVQNYGEAGAVDLFGPRYGLPRALSGHMTHFLWGPGDATGEVVLAYLPDRDALETAFDDVREVARFHDPFVMERQDDRPLFLCRHPRRPLSELWPSVRHYR